MCTCSGNCPDGVAVPPPGIVSVSKAPFTLKFRLEILDRFSCSKFPVTCQRFLTTTPKITMAGPDHPPRGPVPGPWASARRSSRSQWHLSHLTLGRRRLGPLTPLLSLRLPPLRTLPPHCLSSRLRFLVWRPPHRGGNSHAGSSTGRSPSRRNSL